MWSNKGELHTVPTVESYQMDKWKMIPITVLGHCEYRVTLKALVNSHDAF